MDRFIIQFGNGDCDSDDENDVSSSAKCDSSPHDDCSNTSDQASLSEEDVASCCED